QQVLMSRYEKVFSDYSYGFRPNRFLESKADLPALNQPFSVKNGTLRPVCIFHLAKTDFLLQPQ
ncbi:MAG: hypothetical protein ACLFVE_16185, partial [Chitinispirillaceae bacterium]